MLPLKGYTFVEYPGLLAEFREACGDAAWKRVLISLSYLQAKGPLAGPPIRKLTGGDGVWELIASYDSLQPRLLFYFDSKTRGQVVLVYGFIKQRDNMYPHAIQMAKRRRAAIQNGTVRVNSYGVSNTVH